MGKTNKARKYMDDADFNDAMFRKGYNSPSVEEGIEEFERTRRKERLAQKKEKIERGMENCVSMTEKRRLQYHLDEVEGFLKDLE